MKSSNQCQGCQAGWPAVDVGVGVMLHTVVGGYQGEKVLCTKDNYTEDKASSGDKK